MPLSMLYLVCVKLQAWPPGISEMSDLQYFKFTCDILQDQDLAALQHIPHVSLHLKKFSALMLTSGAWQSLEVSGNAGFSINFSDADAFVQGTKQFYFDCNTPEANGMYELPRAACIRQGVACLAWGRGRFCNVRLCGEHRAAKGSHNHERPMRIDDSIWPSRVVYPELYT